MGQKRLAKKVDKLEKRADKLKDQASAKATKLSAQASDKAHELSDKAAVKMGKKQPKKSKKGLLALLATAAAGLGFFVKKKREQELDEALWEEPRAL